MKLLLPLALSTFALTATAQVSKNPLPAHLLPANRTLALTQQILIQQASTDAAAARTTATTQRLVATMQVGDTTADSVVYLWKNTSRPALHNPKIPVSYQYDYSPYGDLSPDASSSRVLYIPADSIRYFSKGVLNSTRSYAYNAANKLQRYTDYTGTQVDQSTSLTYNSAGQNMQASTTDGASTTPYLQQFSAYSTAGKLVSDSIVATLPSAQTVRYLRTYNSSGQLVRVVELTYPAGATTPDSARSSFTYNSNGLLRTALSEEFDASTGAWDVLQKDSILYNGNNAAYTERYYLVDPGIGMLVPILREQNTLNSAGNWSNQVIQTNFTLTGTWDNFVKVAYAYNSFNNYEKVDQYMAASNGSFPATPDMTQRLYYQTYEMGVSDVQPVAEAAFSVVPNPATGAFQIRRSDAAKAAAYQLTDATGRTVAAGTIVAGTAVQSVQRGGLAAGLYLLTVREDGAAPQTQRVVLQ